MSVPNRAHIHRNIFLFFLSVFVLTGQGSIQSSDGKIMYLLTKNMVEHGSLVFTERVSRGDPEGEKYSKYGIGMSVLAIPFYQTGKILARVLNIEDSYATLFCVSMVNSLITALTCLLIYRFARERFGFSHRTAIWLALGFGLSTIAWYYSEDFMSEPATTLFLLAAVYVLTGSGSTHPHKRMVLAGAFLGLAATCRLATLVAVPGFLIYIFWLERGTSGKRKIWGHLVAFGIPIAIFLGLIGLYNFIRFQNFLETGYEHGFGADGFTGLSGILFSPGKSVFLYNPVILGGCLALGIFFRAQKKLAVLFGWLVLSHLLLFSFWHSWYGGMGWGPRLMLVVLPYLVLPAGFMLERTGDWSRKLVPALICLGIFIQIPSVTVNIARYYYDLGVRHGDRAETLLLYSPTHSPLVGQMKEVAVVIRNLSDKTRVREMVHDARSKRRFLEEDTHEVLEHGLAVNVPNFWWYYLHLFGYPRYMSVLPPLIFLMMALVTGYKIFCDRNLFINKTREAHITP